MAQTSSPNIPDRPFDYPNSPLVRCLEFNNSVYDNFKFLWKSRKYSDAGWLVLASLDKFLKENDELTPSTGRLQSSGCEDKLIKEIKELRDSNLQLRTQIRNFKVSQCLLKENLLS